MRQQSQFLVTTRSTKATSYTHVIREYPAGWCAYRFTPWGIVEMYANRVPTLTRIIIIHAGRRYERTFHAFYGPRYAARLATAFAREVVEGRVGV